MKPCINNHPEYEEGCRLCWLFENDERYKKLWEGKATPSKRCVHLGESVKIPGSSKKWRLCLVEEAPLIDGKSVVCSCGTKNSEAWRIGKECGTSCPKWRNKND